MLEKSTQFAAYLAVRVLITLFQSMSLESCDRAARFLAWVFTHMVPIRAKVIDENLQTAFPSLAHPERMQLSQAMWHHLFLMLMEIAHGPRKIHRTTWRKYCVIPKIELVVSTLLADRPTVFITGHLGNFEVGGYLLGLFGFPSHTIARRLDNPYLHRWITEFREATGQFMLDKQGSGPAIAEVLDNCGTLALLGDQAAGAKACWVNFFNRPASTHKAIAVFPLGSLAPTIISNTRRLGSPLHYELAVEDFIDPAAEDFELTTIPLFTQWYTRGLERCILKAPEQYWWVHRRWKGEPSKRERKRLARAEAA